MALWVKHRTLKRGNPGLVAELEWLHDLFHQYVEGVLNWITVLIFRDGRGRAAWGARGGVWGSLKCGVASKVIRGESGGAQHLVSFS